MITLRAPHVRGRNRYSKSTNLYMVRFCRLYGERDIEPFEVRAASEEAAIARALKQRFMELGAGRSEFEGGRIDQCPITGKIAWCKGEKVVYLTGPMEIEVMRADMVNTRRVQPTSDLKGYWGSML